MLEKGGDPLRPPIHPEWTLVDGHLDLAYNAINQGRDLTLPLDELRRLEARREKEAMVTLPELREGGLTIVIATLFTMPARHAAEPSEHTYRDAASACALATRQLELYERWEDAGRVRILRSRRDLTAHARSRQAHPRAAPLGLVLLMEGADPIEAPELVAQWAARGVRLVAPAWKGTRFAGGTGEPGPLTPEGKELVAALAAHGVALDVSHLAEEAFWQALELHAGTIVATHSNARALVGTDRQLSDGMLQALAARRAVVGIVLGDKFLRDDGEAGSELRRSAYATGRSSVSLDDVARHARHLAAHVGWDAVAIGSDLDGGFGRLETPAELDRGRDFARLAAAVPDEHRAAFIGGAWLSLLTRALPDR